MQPPKISGSLWDAYFTPIIDRLIEILLLRCKCIFTSAQSINIVFQPSATHSTQFSFHMHTYGEIRSSMSLPIMFCFSSLKDRVQELTMYSRSNTKIIFHVSQCIKRSCKCNLRLIFSSALHDQTVWRYSKYTGLSNKMPWAVIRITDVHIHCQLIRVFLPETKVSPCCT